MQRMGAGANTLTHRTTLYTFLFKPTSIILTHPSSQPLSHPQTLYHTHAPTITPSNTNPLSHPHTRPPPYNTPMQVFRFDRVLWSHPSLRPSWGKNTDGAPGDPPLFLSILYTPAIDPLIPLYIHFKRSCHSTRCISADRDADCRTYSERHFCDLFRLWSYRYD